MANYLTEAFKQMEALDEDVFSITQEDGVEALDKFLDGDNMDDIELIVDPDAEKPEDIKDSYIGEVILQCPVCATKIYKSQEDIHIDDETNMANVDEECPQCGTVGGFDIIGQIEEYTPDKEGAHEDEEDEHEEHDDDEHDDEEHDEEDDKLEESKKLSENLSYGEIVTIEDEWNKFKSKKGVKGKADPSLAWEFIDTECKGVYDSDDERDEIFSLISTFEESDKYEESKKLSESLSYGEIVAIEDEWKKFKSKKGVKGKADPSLAWEFIDTEGKGVYDSDDERDEIFSLISTFEESDEVTEATSPAKVDSRLDRARARLRKVRADDVADRTARAREAGLRESKVLKEAPIYDLSPRYDSRASFYNKAKVDTGDKGDKNKLYSYNTLVAEIKDGKPVVYGTYSATTLRHIKEWLIQNGFKAENKAQILRDYGVKVDESLEKVDIETEDQKVSMSSDADGKVTVTAEPKEAEVKTDEVIAPVSDETKDEIISNEEETPDEEDIDVDIDEFDEEDFDTLGESYLKKVYNNVDSFKTTSGRLSENKMIFEGVISFNSGKKAKTSFIFEACDATRDGRVKFSGRNPQISKNNKAFTLKGKVKDKKFLSESLNYNYMGKDATTNKSRRVYGTIRKK